MKSYCSQFVIGPKGIPHSATDETAGNHHRIAATSNIIRPMHDPSVSVCAYRMADNESCGRPIYSAPDGTDIPSCCLMHSRDPEKDHAAFTAEIAAIMNGTSSYARRNGVIDFRGFVFNESISFSQTAFTEIAGFSGAVFRQRANFELTTFNQRADFTRVHFDQTASFWKATFNQNADFRDTVFAKEANFWNSTFDQHADFRYAIFVERATLSATTFKQNAYFANTTFNGNATFSQATFTDYGDFTLAAFHLIADFAESRFIEPTHALFRQVNRPHDGKPVPGGLRARFLRCGIEKFLFSDVDWYYKGGRMVLQDELDVREGKGGGPQLVAEVYRQLVANFQSARSYPLAEDCIIGAMEMNRIDPRHFLFGRFHSASRFYKNHKWARCIGQQFSVLNLYRLSSKYGSSYKRAFFCLVFLILFFAGILSAKVSPVIQDSGLRSVLKDGLLASVEIATFQRNPVHSPRTDSGRLVAAAETVAITGQLTLLLLALRRRFRV